MPSLPLSESGSGTASTEDSMSSSVRAGGLSVAWEAGALVSSAITSYRLPIECEARARQERGKSDGEREASSKPQFINSHRLQKRAFFSLHFQEAPWGEAEPRVRTSFPSRSTSKLTVCRYASYTTSQPCLLRRLQDDVQVNAVLTHTPPLLLPLPSPSLLRIPPPVMSSWLA